MYISLKPNFFPFSTTIVSRLSSLLPLAADTHFGRGMSE